MPCAPGSRFRIPLPNLWDPHRPGLCRAVRDRCRGREAGTLAEVAERAIRRLTDGLPPEERAAFVTRVRAQIGVVLSEAPMGAGASVEEIALRARLAAALGASFPEDGT